MGRAFLRIGLLVGPVATGAVIYLIGLEKIFHFLSRADYLYILLSLGCYLLMVLTGVARWIILFGRSIEPRNVVHIYLTSLFFTGLTPGKSGELAIPFLYRKSITPRVAEYTGGVVVDKLFDVVVQIVGVLVAFLLLFRDECLPGSICLKSYFADFGISYMFYGIFGILLFLKIFHCVYMRYIFPRISVIHVYDFSILRIFALSSAAIFSFLLNLQKNMFLIQAFTDITFAQNYVCQVFSNAVGIMILSPGGLGVDSVTYAALSRGFGLDWQAVSTAIIFGGIAFNLVRLCLSACGFYFRRRTCQ